MERLYPKSIRVWRVSTRVLMTVLKITTDLEGDGWCNPVLCDDFPSYIRVERLEDTLELGRSMIVWREYWM